MPKRKKTRKSGSPQPPSKMVHPVSTHLWYHCDNHKDITGFECTLKVPKGKDPIHTYYMACGFTGGYFGMQVNSEYERRILFSVWDDGKGSPVEVVDAHQHALVEPFGGEGEGMHAILQYQWQPDVEYSFRVTALPDPAFKTTIYTGYFFLDDVWTKIAAFRKPADGDYLRGVYSFLENFGHNKDVSQERQCLYGKAKIQREGTSDWIPIDTCICTTTTVEMKGDFFEFCVENNCFSMQIGAKKGSTMKKPKKPAYLSLAE